MLSGMSTKKTIFRLVSLPRGIIKCIESRDTLYQMNEKYIEISTIYECVEKLSMMKGCNI